jgi:hypothetical protein
MKKLFTLVVVVVSVLRASSASAIGDNEKNVLAVLGGVFLVDKIADHYTKKSKEKCNHSVHNEHIDKHIREQKIRAEMEIAIKKRKARNCLELGECDSIYFK